MNNQLIKETTLGRELVFPKNYILNLKDKESGASLEDILKSFNMYFLSYTGNTALTRCQVPKDLRKEGLWITYVTFNHTVVTEWYNSDNIDNATWGSDTYWRQGSNKLVGDISISMNGNWVIGGKETEFKATGDPIKPMLRISPNNKLQVTYDEGKHYENLGDNPVYTEFRFNSDTNTYLLSTDLGKTWTDISDEKVFYNFRTYNNKLLVSTDLGNTWQDTSEYIAAWFRWVDADGNGNLGKILISRDNNTWEDMTPNFVNNLYIKGYVATVGDLPTSTAALGDIYMVGPTYDDSDTNHDYPHYRMWVKLTDGWVDNGEYYNNIILAQTTGLDSAITMSQKAITETIKQETDRAMVAEEANATSIKLLIEHLTKTATFAGIATPTTNPGTPDGPVFYLTSTIGTYINFSNIEILQSDGGVLLLWSNGKWSKKITGFATSIQVENINKLICKKENVDFRLHGYYYDDVYVNDELWRCTGKIYIGKSVTTIKTAGYSGVSKGIQFFKKDGSWLSGTTFGDFTQEDIPTDAAYIAVSSKASYANAVCYIERSVSSAITEIVDKINDNSDLESESLKLSNRIDDVNSNICKQESLDFPETGYYIGKSFYEDTKWINTGLVFIKSATEITCNGESTGTSTSLNIFDDNKTWLVSMAYGTYTKQDLPENACFAVVCSKKVTSLNKPVCLIKSSVSKNFTYLQTQISSINSNISANAANIINVENRVDKNIAAKIDKNIAAKIAYDTLIEVSQPQLYNLYDPNAVFKKQYWKLDGDISMTTADDALSSGKIVLKNGQMYCSMGVQQTAYLYIWHITTSGIAKRQLEIHSSPGLAFFKAQLPQDYDYSQITFAVRADQVDVPFNADSSCLCEVSDDKSVPPFYKYGIPMSSYMINPKAIYSDVERRKLFLDGASFADWNMDFNAEDPNRPGNGWFEIACEKLGLEPLNKALSGSSIIDVARGLSKINDADGNCCKYPWTEEEFEEFDILCLMHVHNYNVADTTNIKISYDGTEDFLNRPLNRNTKGFYISDKFIEDYAPAYDYVLKEYAKQCYACKDKIGSRWYGTKMGKPFKVICCTHWHDGRTTFNDAIRVLQQKWGFELCEFDKHIGFSKNQINPATNAQFSIDYCNNGISDTEQINGVTYGWHQTRGKDAYIQNIMATIFEDAIKKIVNAPSFSK